MEVFTSKIDTWILITLGIAVLVSICAVIVCTNKGGILGYLSALFILVLGVILPTWLLTTTKYVVSEQELNIQSGPFSWTIPTASISSVQETRNSRSSPALSLDRLKINYGDNKSIMISPKNKAKFRQAIGH